MCDQSVDQANAEPTEEQIQEYVYEQNLKQIKEFGVSFYNVNADEQSDTFLASIGRFNPRDPEPYPDIIVIGLSGETRSKVAQAFVDSKINLVTGDGVFTLDGFPRHKFKLWEYPSHMDLSSEPLWYYVSPIISFIVKDHEASSTPDKALCVCIRQLIMSDDKGKFLEEYTSLADVSDEIRSQYPPKLYRNQHVTAADIRLGQEMSK